MNSDMDKEELKQKLLDLRGFTVPQIQHDFNVSYGAARQCVEELLRDDLIRPVNRLRYAVRQRRRKAIPQRDLLRNVHSDTDRMESTFMDACIVSQFDSMRPATRNELENILRSALPEGLPLTETVQNAMDVLAFFADKNIRLILRGVQFGKEKLRCVYYAPNRLHDPTVNDVIGKYKHERNKSLRMHVIYKYLSFGLFVVDFLYDEELPAIGKQVAQQLVDKKVPKYELSAIRDKCGFYISDFYRSITKLERLGILNEFPAPHGSVAYKFAVDAKYFAHLLPDYLWR